MNRSEALILAAVLALALCSIGASFMPASLTPQGFASGTVAAQGTRKPACGCFVCGNLPGMHTVTFDNTDCAGILAEDACTEQLANMPSRQIEAFCRKLENESQFRSFKDSCPVFAPLCEPKTEKATENEPKDEKRKCEPPTPPWFSTQDCKDLQDPVVEFTQQQLDVYLCGYKIFSRTPATAAHPEMFTDALFAQAYRTALRDNLRAQVPRKVCCNQFRQAAMTGRPCDSAADVDCDGRLNNVDADGDLPEINGLAFTENVPPTAPRDLFPQGLNDDALMPTEECKDCKWELIKGVLKCNADPSQRHSYEATWRCPPTGAVVEVVKLSPPGVNCSPR